MNTIEHIQFKIVILLTNEKFNMNTIEPIKYIQTPELGKIKLLPTDKAENRKLSFLNLNTHEDGTFYFDVVLGGFPYRIYSTNESYIQSLKSSISYCFADDVESVDRINNIGSCRICYENNCAIISNRYTHSINIKHLTKKLNIEDNFPYHNLIFIDIPNVGLIKINNITHVSSIKTNNVNDSSFYKFNIQCNDNNYFEIKSLQYDDILTFRSAILSVIKNQAINYIPSKNYSQDKKVKYFHWYTVEYTTNTATIFKKIN